MGRPETKQRTTHEGELVSLKRIEGQIRGVQKMIEDRRYCIDILTQLHSVVGAIQRVEGKILQGHLEGCVAHALRGKTEVEKNAKIREVIELLGKFRKSS